MENEIPKNIQDSLLSERVDEILEEIRKEAGIFDEGLLFPLYYRLISKEIPAHDFVKALAETGIGEKIARSVAKAIKERILESERYPLFKWGVDISDINVADAPDLETLGLREFLEGPKEETKTISLEEIEEKEEKVKIITPKTLSPQKEVVAGESSKETPFILQPRENLPQQETTSTSKSISSFSLGSIGFFKPKRKIADSSGETVSVTAKVAIETPKEEKKKEEKKVVHYSESRTSLNPLEEGSFIKRETVFVPQEHISQDNIPTEKEKMETNSAKNDTSNTSKEAEEKELKEVQILEDKNIIDLRQ